VSGLPVRDSVARLELICAPVELAAEEGWALVALEGEVVDSALLLEARREGAGRCSGQLPLWLQDRGGRDLLNVRARGVKARRRVATV
jgi:hypothetical protein